MKEIELTQGKVALVDDEDYEKLIKHRWYATYGGGLWYAARQRHRIDGPRPPQIWMHRAILKPTDEERVDHINRNGLDNQRSNLRIATHAQNMANSKKQTNNTSGYKGVSFNKWNGRWFAQIGGGEDRFIGYFDTPLEAAAAYNEAALERYGEFARLNEFEGEEQ